MTPVLQGGRMGSRSGSGKSHSRHSGHFWIWLQRGGAHSSGDVQGVLRRGGLGTSDECWRNAPGMSDGAACSTRADVASGEITGSSFHRCLPFFFSFFPTHTHGSAHTFQWNILRCTTIKGEKVNPQLENGGYLQPSQMVLFTFYKDLCL